MKRLRFVGIILSTLATLLLLAFIIGGVIEKVHDWQYWLRFNDPLLWLSSLIQLLFGFLIVFAMLAGVIGLWSRLVRQKIVQEKIVQGRAESLPSSLAPRSKYAVWSIDIERRVGRPVEQSRSGVFKSLRRKR